MLCAGSFFIGWGLPSLPAMLVWWMRRRKPSRRRREAQLQALIELRHSIAEMPEDAQREFFEAVDGPDRTQMDDIVNKASDHIQSGALCSKCKKCPATVATRLVARDDTMAADGILWGGGTCWGCANELGKMLGRDHG